MRAAAALAALLCSLPVQAHDLITAEVAERYLEQAKTWRARAAVPAPSAQRADAHYRLGVMLDEVRDLLNLDIATHGKVQGLASEFLVAELERQGAPLAHADSRRRYLSNGRHFEEALKLAPHAAFAADAGFRLLRGRFYDSFDRDPLDWRSDSRALPTEIALAEDLVARFPAHAAREEIEFIAVILYTRAARSLPDRKLAARYAAKARSAITDFASRYPSSLRAAAMPVLREAIPQY